MTELNVLLLGYNKFVIMKINMAIANKKYRETENGKEKTKILRKKWTANHKEDDNYRIKINLQSKLRYHRQIDMNDDDAYRKKLNLQAKIRSHNKKKKILELEKTQVSIADSLAK